MGIKDFFLSFYLKIASPALKMALPMIYGSNGAVIKAFYKKYGDDACEILAQVMNKVGKAIGEQLKPQCPGEDLETVAAFYDKLHSLMGIEHSLELRENEAVLMVPHCMYGLELDQFGYEAVVDGRKLCEALTTVDAATIGTLSPKLTAGVGKMCLTAGDPYCEIVIKPKKQ